MLDLVLQVSEPQEVPIRERLLDTGHYSRSTTDQLLLTSPQPAPTSTSSPLKQEEKRMGSSTSVSWTNKIGNETGQTYKLVESGKIIENFNRS